MSFFHQQEKTLAYIQGVNNSIWRFASTVIRSGVIVDGVLHTIVVPSALVDSMVDGQCLYFSGTGRHDGNTSTKALNIRINGTLHMIATFPTGANPLGWYAFGAIQKNEGVYTAALEVRHNYSIVSANGATVTVLGTQRTLTITPGVDTTIEFSASVPSVGDSVRQFLSTLSVI